MLRLDRRAMAVLAFAHLTDDVNQSFLPALLPFLIAQRGLDYASAATLIFAANISSSVVQPGIGWLADRRPMPWVIPLGLLLAGGGIALVGVAPTYGLMLLAALVSGIGVAAFHPEAARLANYAAGDRKSSGMRWFAAGGNAGFAIGPLFAGAAVTAFGLRGSLAGFVPVVLMAIVVALELSRLRGFVPRKAAPGAVVPPDDWAGFARLSIFVVFRSMTFIGLVAFVPLYFVSVLHASAQVASVALTVLLASGVIGTLAGGSIADRYGRRRVLVWSTGLSTAAIFAFVALTPGNGLMLAFAGAALIGFVLVASQASYVVLGQEFLPNRMGVASGVTLGLAVSLGGVASPVLGAIGDTHGLVAVFVAIGALCAVTFVAALAVPAPTTKAAVSAARV
jgi:FSR family fosmidomycin resistance protein-like MFS transporter